MAKSAVGPVQGIDIRLSPKCATAGTGVTFSAGAVYDPAVMCRVCRMGQGTVFMSGIAGEVRPVRLHFTPDDMITAWML